MVTRISAERQQRYCQHSLCFVFVFPPREWVWGWDTHTRWEGGPGVNHLGGAQGVEDAVVLRARGPAEPRHLDGLF